MKLYRIGRPDFLKGLYELVGAFAVLAPWRIGGYGSGLLWDGRRMNTTTGSAALATKSSAETPETLLGSSLRSHRIFEIFD